MKKLLILWLLIAAVANGAAYLDISAYWTQDGVPYTDVDSIVVLARHWGTAVAYHWVSNAPDSSVWDTTAAVDSLAEYDLTYHWWRGASSVMRDKDRAWSYGLASPFAANMTQISGSADAADSAEAKMLAARTPLAADNAAAVWTGTAIGDKTVTVNAIAANAITAASMASNCITSDEIATTGVTEIMLGIWDVDTIGHSVVGTMGGEFNRVTLSATGAAEAADAVWNEAQAGHTTDGTFGKFVDTTISSRATEAGTGITEEQTWAMLDSLSAGVLDVTATLSMWPLLGYKFEVDTNGTNACTQFVVDTASLGIYSSNWTALRNRLYVLTRLSDSAVQIPLTIHSIAYTGANCTLTVVDSIPVGFSTGDSIVMTSFPAYEFATLGEACGAAADSTHFRDSAYATGTAATFGSVVISSGGTADTTNILTALANNNYDDARDSTLVMSATAGDSGALRRGEIVDSTRFAKWKLRYVDSLALLGGAVLAQNIGINWGDVSNATDTVDLTNTRMQAVDTAANAATACTGSGLNSVTMYARDTLNDVRVADVNITMTSGAVTYWAWTDTDGKIVFSLDDGDWVATGNDGIRSYVSKTVTVNGTEIDSLNGGGLTVSAPADASLCAVYGTWNYGEYAKARFELMPSNVAIIDTSTNQYWVGVVRDTVLNASGYVAINLPKTENMIYRSGAQKLHPSWRVRIGKESPTENPWIDQTFTIDADSTTLDLAKWFK